MISYKIFFVCLTIMTITWSGKAETNEIPSDTSENPDSDHDRLAAAINDFGYKLSLEMMKQNPNNNIVISPAGIAGLLAMTLLGSVGKTYDELADALGFSQDISENRHHHLELGNLLKSLNSDVSSSTTLYADTVIADAATQLREDYRSYLQRVYQGDAMTLDFKDSNSTILINDWVKQHTLGKIENFLEQPLPTQTKVVLLSALYFSGQWQQPFAPEHTRKMPFSTSIGDIMVDSMLNLGWFNYTSSFSDGVQMIAFPYIDSTTTMYVLLPIYPKRQNLTELLLNLAYSKIDDLITQMHNTECVVRFPKMKLKSRVDIRESLKGLGVKTVFEPAEANFALMVDGNTIVNKSEEELITRINSGSESHWNEFVSRLPNPGVHVDSVLHDVKITIDEYGTEAVAASSAFLARTAQLFYVQSPFYMFIRNERTKLVTFSAIIFDPTV